MRINLVTGGAGFIGSALVRRLLSDGETVIVLDALTYSGRLENLRELEADKRFQFVHGSISDVELVTRLIGEHQPDAIINVAAESHVDRSIDEPSKFLDTNINGVFVLLEAALDCWRAYANEKRDGFRFLQVSTDEVFGSVETGSAKETAPYRPNSPYSATKASSDMLVRAYNKTYGLPVVTSHGSNTYGPRQYPEKLLPLFILRALSGMSLPVYGDGANVREWLHVDDHVSGIVQVLRKGKTGQAYNIGSGTGLKNIDVTKMLCQALGTLTGKDTSDDFDSLIEFVADRPGHDARYSLDISKSLKELDWAPTIDFTDGLASTVQWYIDRRDWWEPITRGQYSLNRLGTSTES
jgi:dTDP-glucose 4,6-dehydratase